jgi:hypothetical protein
MMIRRGNTMRDTGAEASVYCALKQKFPRQIAFLKVAHHTEDPSDHERPMKAT